tara:strand:+ start:219 stop:458 length:240 start_codon:yes stop_codon:yes gene_type:complete
MVDEKEAPLKNMIVEYVGEKLSSDGEVTVEMVVEVLAEEFPEFLMLVAEENWIRGYEQGLADVSEGERLMNESVENNEE